MSAHYDATPKPFIFWDTCALLDAIRFLARQGSLTTFRSISSISEMIHTGKVYSLASELTIKEWNDHVDEAEVELLNYLRKVTFSHEATLKVVNHLYSSSFTTVSLENHYLNSIFDNITKTIIQGSIFISEAPDFHLKAYDRVAQKLPPASKKNEAKDCTIWETVLNVAGKIQAKKPCYPINGVFFTSNTDDFVKKDKMQFYPSLLKESHDRHFCCCMNYEDSMQSLLHITGDWGI